MRFVAQYSGYQIKIRDPQAHVTSWGVEQTVQGIVAAFDKNDWLQRDYETALRSFKFKGMYQHEDEATPVEPTYRVAVYDTEDEQAKHGWDDELREEVERKLLSAKAFGRDYVLVQEIAIEPPWPTYDLFRGSPEELVAQVGDLGYLYSDALAYEESQMGAAARGRDRRAHAGSLRAGRGRDHRDGLLT